MSLLLKAGITKLSQLTIDADKDWDGKGITNLKELADVTLAFIELERETETQANWATGVLSDVEAIIDGLALDSTRVESEDTYDTANLTGSAYTVIYNRMEFKSAGTLTKVKVKTKTAGDYILRIKSDDGVTTHQTHTIEGAAADSWITFTIDDLVVGIGDKYRMEVTRPSGTAYAASGLYDGTHWKNNKGAFDGAEYDYTHAMGFILLIPEYALAGYRVAPPLSLSTITDVNTSIVEWTEDKPAGTDIKVKFAINDDPVTEPPIGDYIAAVNGDPIPRITPHADLTGKWLWARQELSTVDNTKTPELQTAREYIRSNEKEAIVAPMQKGDMVFFEGTTLVKLSPGPLGNELTSSGPGAVVKWEAPPG
ncbi:hypothetical protein ES703_74709 [subsurface metagenome]